MGGPLRPRPRLVGAASSVAGMQPSWAPWPRDIVKVTGVDTATFLQSQISQDIRALRGKIQWSLDGDWTQPEHNVQEPRADWTTSAAKSAVAKSSAVKAPR